LPEKTYYQVRIKCKSINREAHVLQVFHTVIISPAFPSLQFQVT
jgi:hypothetical protein